MSLLEKLVRQLGSVDLDPTGLVLLVDGHEVSAKKAITIRVRQAATEVRPASDADESAEEKDEWEWQLAMARARQAAADSAARDDEAEWERKLAAARMQVAQPTQPHTVPRPKRLPSGTEPPVSLDEDVTTEIDIRPRRKNLAPLPGMPPALRRRTPRQKRAAARPHTRERRERTAASVAPVARSRAIPMPPPLPPPPGETD